MQFLNFKKNIFSILMLAFTFLVVGRVEGQTTYTGNFSTTITQFSGSPQNITISSQTWTLTNNGGFYGFDGAKGQQIGSSGSPASSMTLSSNGFQGLITAVKITTSGASSVVANVSVSINGSSFGGAAQSITSTSTQYTFSGSSSGAVSIAWSQTSSKALYIRSVQVIYTTSPTITGAATTAPFTSTFGTASTAQTFGVSGSNLTASLIATAPTGFEVSSDGTTYGSTAAFTQSSGSASGTLYIRLSSSAPVGTYNSQNIVLSSTGATSVNITTPSSGNAVTCTSGTWLGSSTGNWNTASNWCGGVPTSGSNLTIPAGTTITLDGTNEVTVGDLTINATGSLILPTNARLTVTGNLVNNGTMTIESGATLDQTTNSSTISGTGTYIVKQALPTNRYWYLGVPIGAYTEASFLTNLTSGETLKKRDEAGNQWVTVTSNSTAIPAGRGYYVQNPNSTPTITFQGTGASSAFNNGAITTENLTSSGSGFQGFNLVSNPYPSYIDWTTVTKTNIDGTMWYRTHDGSGMNFGTVNSSGVGTTIGSTILTRYIPPMQSFWVRVSNFGQAASLTFNNTDRSHFIAENNSVAGLKSTNDNDFVLIRMNLKQSEKMDQLIVYTEDQATNGLDQLDADKMMQANYPQFYTSVGGKKIVINALNAAKKQQSLPITMELPTTGVHSFIIEDLEISNGLVWLEDKQEEIIQTLEPGTVYEFYAASGMNSERFVLHFQLIDDAVPTNVYNQVNSSANFSGKGANVHAESAGVVVIKLPASTEGITDIQIRDAAGRVVYTGSTNTLETNVQLEQANGIYYVTLNSTSGVEVRKVFIQQ